MPGLGGAEPDPPLSAFRAPRCAQGARSISGKATGSREKDQRFPATDENEAMKKKVTDQAASREGSLGLLDKLIEHLDLAKAPLDEIERALEEVKAEVGQRSLAAIVARLPAETKKRSACPKCGRGAPVRTYGVERTLATLSGTVSFRRNYHYCKDCSLGFYPRDMMLGLPEHGDLSTELEKRVLDFGVNEPFAEAASRFEVHYEHRISPNQVRQAVKRLGEQLEATTEDLLQLELFAEEEKAGDEDPLYILNDGSMVSMQSGDWREVKLGVVFRRKNAPRPTKRHPRGRMGPARYVAVLGDQDAFFSSLKSALDAEGADKAKKVVWIADGARGNWTLAGACTPRAIQVLDFHHAIENGMKCARTLLGEESPWLEMWQATLKAQLLAGRVEDVIDQLMDVMEEVDDDALCALNALVGYFRENAERMRYDRYLEEGLMIGSGVVESAHRHVIQKRMKLAGQHWGETTGRRMARIRAAYKTAGPKRAHTAIRRAHQATRKNAAWDELLKSARARSKKVA